MATIAFLGLGAMGARMAAKLRNAGHTVRVWNRDPTRAAPLAAMGAVVASSPKAAAVGAEIVISMLRDDSASRWVWTDSEAGALGAMPTEAIAIDCSTVTIGWAKLLAARAAVLGIPFLDAPVSGSRPQAEAGQLIFLAGGDRAVLARAEPVLNIMGRAIHHTGPNGTGAAIKLAINSMFGIQVAAIAELLALMHPHGVAPARAAEILASTPVASPAANFAAQSMLSGAFEPMFPIELAAKDFAYIEAMAQDLLAATPMATAARAVMQRALDRGYGAENITAISRLYAMFRNLDVSNPPATNIQLGA